MEAGIIGLPNVGKSTIFNALTKSNANVSNFPFTTIEPNIGITTVEDERLIELGKIFRPEKLTSATVKFVDIAGLVRGASKGEGLGNKFLSHIREVDVLVQVVRVFNDDSIVSTLGELNPINEIEIIDLELILSDLEQILKARERIINKAKSGDKDSQEKLVILDEIRDHLNKNRPIRENELLLSKISESDIKNYELHTAKSVLYLFNINDSVSTDVIDTLVKFVSEKKKCDSILLNAKLELELSELNNEEKEKFRKEYNLKSGINDLVKKVYEMLNLITFYTVVGNEVRAWSIPKGTTAKTAAGKIHTDMEKGFIRAEVYNYNDLIKYRSEKILFERGIIRTEGKDYIVSDGDIIKFKFH
jgi:GTP-binding protein YchF